MIGSQKTHCDCDFPLAQFLIITGIVGLSMSFIDLIAPKIEKWISEETVITKMEYAIKVILRGISFTLLLAQLGALIGESTLVYYNYSNVSHNKSIFYDDNPNETNCKKNRIKAVMAQDGPVYCDYSLFQFSFYLVTIVWIFLVFALICLAYIYVGSPKKQKK